MFSVKKRNTEALKKESMYEDLVASKEKIIKMQNDQIAMYEKMISMKDIFSDIKKIQNELRTEILNKKGRVNKNENNKNNSKKGKQGR